jgi:hypothetical protein
MISHHLPPRLLFYILGLISTIWFLIRVIPKPIRATYPCMKVAAPFMAGLVAYLLAVGGLTALSRKLRYKIINVRYSASFFLIFGVVAMMAVTPSVSESSQVTDERPGPEDKPNEPFGTPQGIFPGRVVWVWDQNATNENFKQDDFDTQDWFWESQNTNEKVVADMFRNGITKLTGKSDPKQSWDALFKTFNEKKLNISKGYTKGEKIYIKINQGQSRWILLKEDKDNGYYLPQSLKTGTERRKVNMLPAETGPYVVLEVLRELVNEAGIDQADISIGDPMCPIWGHNFEVWHKEFPNINYIDRISESFNRTIVTPTDTENLIYSDKYDKDKIYDIALNADYLINMAILKPHGAAGISLSAKNHFGDIGRPTAGHLHRSHLAARREGSPDNAGYRKYRVLVDLMGSKYLGQNTMIFIVEGLFGGGSNETMPAVQYFMPPFNNDWCNSLFLSQDMIAIQSVGFDILRTEWNGINKHNPINSAWEAMPNVSGVDDFLHQGADSKNWPEGVIYDPDNSGKPMPSLGVHEHWNNAKEMKYSRDLGKKYGVELVTIPETLRKKNL